MSRIEAICHSISPGSRGVNPRPPRVARLVEIALACGYYDQAHFIREFRDFAGVTPTTYVRTRVAHRGHLPLD